MALMELHVHTAGYRDDSVHDKYRAHYSRRLAEVKEMEYLANRTYCTWQPERHPNIATNRGSIPKQNYRS